MVSGVMGVIGVTVAEPDIDRAGDSIPVPILPSYVEVVAVVVVLDEDFIVAFVWVEVESEELALIVLLLLLLPMLLLSGGWSRK